MKAAVLGISIVASMSVAGTVSTYSDRAVFETAAGGSLSIEDFTDARRFPITSGQLNSHTDETFLDGPPIQPGDLEAGVTYSTLVGSDRVFAIDFGAGYHHGFLSALALNDVDKAPLIIDFHGDDPMDDRAVSAFGFDMGSLRNGGSTTMVISFSDLADLTIVLDYPTNLDIEFYGFISDSANITSVSIINNGDTSTSFDIDNFTFDTVPTPSSVSLLVLCCLATSRRQR